jgi:hypothetical protein
LELTSSLVVMAPVDPDCKAPASIRSSAIAADADTRRPNFPRHIDDLRRFPTPVYPLEQQAGLL